MDIFLLSFVFFLPVFSVLLLKYKRIKRLGKELIKNLTQDRY